MLIGDLDYSYPPELIAQRPTRPCRVAFVSPSEPAVELTFVELLSKFRPGDLLVINETQVIPARVFAHDATEILFLKAQSEKQWEVLFPARDFRPGDELALPGGLMLKLEKKGLPQIVSLSQPLTNEYLEKYGEMALPPYIQEARQQRHNYQEDKAWYQTDWAKNLGSVAAPTASLHFQQSDLDQLAARGVEIARVTLHVGAGTFLPIKVDSLQQHVMHSEYAEISATAAQNIAATQSCGGRIWALGTTVMRTLESMAAGWLEKQADGSFHGETRLFIYPPYEFRVVGALLTNFHQPRSTLLSLVAAFAGLDRVKNVYAWAIDRRFQLFSYGDLSAWIKP